MFAAESEDFTGESEVYTTEARDIKAKPAAQLGDAKRGSLGFCFGYGVQKVRLLRNALALR